MSPQATEAPTLVRRYRLRLKQGFHVEHDEYGRDTYYRQGDVFLSKLPLYRKWPEKFDRMERHVPLKGGEMKLLDPGTPSDPTPEPEDLTESEEVEIYSSQKPPSDMPYEEVPAFTQADLARTSLQREGITNSPVGGIPAVAKELPPIDNETLTAMTINELKSFAEEEEIDLKGASRKEDILRIIRQHRDSPST